jgi:hypothetical protein
MSAKNISLEKTSAAIRELMSALSACSAVLNEKKINADAKEAEYQQKIQLAQNKIDMLKQSSQNTIACIDELAAKIDKVLN